jgi:5-methylcytosine-specific restriction enzyme subunit McrC
VVAMSLHYKIREFDSFTRNVVVASLNYYALPELVFDQLEQFILTQNSEQETNPLELMVISSKRGIGKVISARNYVGLITMSNGTVIEILPKLYTQQNEASEIETKTVFLEMLKFLKEVPYKSFNHSNLHIMNHNIIEIFIRMFVEEVYKLVKGGLKSTYIDYQDNEFFLKGKLDFARHINANYLHKERFYITYDLFSVNRAENRLIKTTLDFLRRVSSSSKNRKDIHTLFAVFDKVDDSVHPDKDFEQIVLDRNNLEYKTILQWCKIFLQRKSFTAFKGSEIAFALLFPMEKVFESYVAERLYQFLDSSIYKVKLQDRGCHLFEAPKTFQLRPDIVIEGNDSTIILDTKWKLLNAKHSNLGVSQADMYQSFAYSHKYRAKDVFLLYPWTTSVNDLTTPVIYSNPNGERVSIGFVDLTNTVGSFQELADSIRVRLAGGISV